MIRKLLWWKKPHVRSVTISFWKGEAMHWMLKYRAQCLHCDNLKGLIEERDATIKALREEVISGKIYVNEARAQIEAMQTGGHA